MLAAVERELADEAFVVVGVHSPKFPSERDPGLVAEAVRRHGITHPVVVDAGQRLWDAYAVRAWPTLVIVGADGRIVGAASGEPDAAPLLLALSGVLEQQRALLSGSPLPLRPEAGPPGTLAFPGGIAVGAEAVYVADTGHHQVVACAPDGRELRRFGAGTPGLRDGAQEARLHSPHGLAVHGRTLYVADTGNHAVRAVDLDTDEVRTVAGTGQRGRSADGAGSATAVALRSPWDVAVTGAGDLLVAMAGSHQLWGVADGIAAVYAGSGREARVDGDLVTAAFAQPSGLAWGDDAALYVADSEISAVRRVSGGRVSTVAGGDLFAFGDVDGIGDQARFQHPVGIAPGPRSTLLVADTLNHKIKSLDQATSRVRTLLGDGMPFDAPLASLEHRPSLPPDLRCAAAFREPEAVAWTGGRILVVDTGNHRVVAVDPATGSARLWLGGEVQTPPRARTSSIAP
ncbi:MAG: alkyl hydroperoxide reductase [Actinomycetota bacterium]|nr:alkyl hydroperoxide reductase [Euzebyales bacterium]MDQ3343064.1 alkyl hydroperoxide reductase [Actinomycetota bacterium]MDQ3528436.1 alkyl hydroperoxide reductase [Actinomycetota bacterium]